MKPQSSNLFWFDFNGISGTLLRLDPWPWSENKRMPNFETLVCVGHRLDN